MARGKGGERRSIADQALEAKLDHPANWRDRWAMKSPTAPDPQPISMEDAKRIWTLQKQNAPLSLEDQALLHQACEWQMWVSHGIRLQSKPGRAGRN